MSLLYENTVKHNLGFSNRIQPRGVTRSNFQFCFTCTKIRAPPECVSVVLELQDLGTDEGTKANILQVICQLLRVQLGSLDSDILENGNLPFCSLCLKAVTAILILREKLLQIEIEIREKLCKLESSVAACWDAYEQNLIDEKPLKDYNDLRTLFQKQVMEEYLNKELLQSKIVELNNNPGASSVESTPSMVQFHLEKNVFSIMDRKPLPEEDESTYKCPLVVFDSADTYEDWGVDEGHFSQVFRGSKFGDFEDNDLPPVLEVEDDCTIVPTAFQNEEDFNLLSMTHDPTTGIITFTSDESDYVSPSKKSRTELMTDISRLRKSKAKFPVLEKSILRTPVSNARIIQNTKPKTAKSTPKFLFLSNGEGDLWQETFRVEDEMTTTDSAPPRSSIQDMGSDSHEDSNFDNEDGDSDWIPEKDKDSVRLEDSDSDRKNGERESENGKVEDVEGESDPERATTISIYELCQSQIFKPKNEGDFVKIEQAEATFQARDKTYWTTREPNQNRKKRAYEILRQDGGLVGPAQDKMLTPTQLFKLMFPPTIVQTIVKHTNAYAEYLSAATPDKNGKFQKWRSLTVDELYAYIGMLLYFGVVGKRGFNYQDVWNQDNQDVAPALAATMGRDRFKQITSFLRFDDKVARMTTFSINEVEEDEDSKFSYISEVFNPFAENIQSHLRPYDTLTMGQIFVKFNGSSSFRVLVKSKAGSKYGMKLWTVCDVETGYILNISLHEGKGVDKGEKQLGKKIVLDLVQAYFGSGRGVTMDKSFTSVALGKALMNKNMSMLGTLDHKGLDTIPEFVTTAGREVHSSVFAFQGDFTMVSYFPKESNQAILLLSTRHNSAEINSNIKNEPKMLVDYNCTQGTVETAESMIDSYTCQRTTQRWPLKIFYALLDIAALNSYSIYRMHKGSDEAAAHFELRDFIKNLAEGLMDPVIANRQIQINPVCKEFLLARANELHKSNNEDDNNQESPSLRIAKRCKFCPSGERRRGRRICGMCQNATCRECGTLFFHCPKCPFEQVSSARKNLSPIFDSDCVSPNIGNSKFRTSVMKSARRCKYCATKTRRRCDVCQESACHQCGTFIFRCPECPLLAMPSEQNNISTIFDSERVVSKVSNFSIPLPSQLQHPIFSTSSPRPLLICPNPLDSFSPPNPLLSAPNPVVSSPNPLVSSPRRLTPVFLISTSPQLPFLLSPSLATKLPEPRS